MNAAHTPALEVRISAVDPAELHAASILVVDDEPANVRLLERVVRGAGYANLTSTTDPREVSRLCDEAEPHLILLDLTKTHTLVGARILGGSSFPVLQMAEQIARCHHERWDGTGYPRGLRGEEIPIAARIVAVVDVWDALTHERPYKHAWSIKEAAAELRLQAGRHFDPRVVDAFLQVQEKGTQIALDWPSVPPV